MNDDFLLKKINERKEQNAFRQLRLPGDSIDFCSNDYLGMVKNNVLKSVLANGHDLFGSENTEAASGSTGSRLLSGNYALIVEAERDIAIFHDAPAGLIFNSGYDANTGLLSCVPQRGDAVIYDYLSHASIRDGSRLSSATTLSYQHNDMEDLERKLKETPGNKFVVTESVFSMDGDLAPLFDIVELCERHQSHLIVDEAHATGVIGSKGEGLVQTLNLQHRCFARIHTFGKACGAHGAIVLGSKNLRDYLINFSRAFIYTTALPASSIKLVLASYKIFPLFNNERMHLRQLAQQLQTCSFPYQLLASETPIQGLVIPGNEQVRTAAQLLQNEGFDVRPILYPTVPKGKERLRIVLHAFNAREEVSKLADLLTQAG